MPPSQVLPMMRHHLSTPRKWGCYRFSFALGLVTGLLSWSANPALAYGAGTPIVAEPPIEAIAPRSSRFQLAQQLNFNVNNVRPSRGRSGGFSRGSACFTNPAESSPPVALVPVDTSTEFERIRVETTVDAQPTFFVFLPEMDKVPEAGELLIFEQAPNNTEIIVHTQLVPLPQTAGAGFIPVNFSDGFALDVDKTYRWTFEVLCSTEDRSSNVFAEGWVERVDPGDGLVAMLAQSDPELYPELYATAGHWYDTLESLVALWQENPGSPVLENDWVSLLSSVNLGDLASYPLLDAEASPAQESVPNGTGAGSDVGG